MVPPCNFRNTLYQWKKGLYPSWMMAFRVVQGSIFLFLDTPLEPQLHKQNRLVEQLRFMGDSWGRLLPPNGLII
jgi:hypothetical protein